MRIIRKYLYALVLTMAMLFAFTACGGNTTQQPDTTHEANITTQPEPTNDTDANQEPLFYRFENLGIQFAFPAEWQGKYILNEFEHRARHALRVSRRATMESSSYAQGWLFDFVKYPGYIEVEDLVPNGRLLARQGGYTFLMSLPSDVQWDINTPEGDEYQEMTAQLDFIISSFELIKADSAQTTQEVSISTPNPFAAPLLDYFADSLDAPDPGMQSTKAFMADVRGSSNPGIVAIRHAMSDDSPWVFAQARIFYFVDGQLIYKDIPHIEGFPYSLAVNPEGRLVMPGGDGGYNFWTFFVANGSMSVDALYYGHTIYRDTIMDIDGDITTLITNYYISYGNTDGLRDSITEERFNTEFQEFSLDNLTLWFNIEDETEQILAMTFE